MKFNKLALQITLSAVTLSSCGKAGSKIATKVGEEITERTMKGGAEDMVVKTSGRIATKATTKPTLKVVLKNSIKVAAEKLPTQSEVLKVRMVGDRYEPILNNLGKKSGRYSDKFNGQLLLMRRKAISPYFQFITKDVYKEMDYSKMIIGKPADASILEKNMLAAMPPKIRKIVNAFGGKASHHIVEGTDAAARGSRSILSKFNIDINDAVNGVFLPTDKNSIFKGTLHKTGHNAEYSKYVYEQLRNCNSKDEVVEKLNKIANELYDGKIVLEKSKHAVNKNIL